MVLQIASSGSDKKYKVNVKPAVPLKCNVALQQLYTHFSANGFYRDKNY